MQMRFGDVLSVDQAASSENLAANLTRRIVATGTGTLSRNCRTSSLAAPGAALPEPTKAGT